MHGKSLPGNEVSRQKIKMFDQKEVPDYIPTSHALDQKEAIKKFHMNNDDITITWLGHAAFLIKLIEL